jgi:hypothetical protein
VLAAARARRIGRTTDVGGAVGTGLLEPVTAAPGASASPTRELGTGTDVEIIASLARVTSEQCVGDAAMTAVAEAAALLVPGIRWVSVCRGSQGQLLTCAATDDVAREMDAAQHRLGTGPSLSALYEDPAAFVSSDLAADGRWPRLGPEAHTTPVRSVFAARLVLGVDDRNPYVVTFYTDQPGAFDELDMRVRADRCVAVVGLAVACALSRDHARNLSNALASNREIGVGMGVLMASHRITRSQAFDLLRTASQNSNRKLRDVASEVADTGILDMPPARSRRARGAGRWAPSQSRRPA